MKISKVLLLACCFFILQKSNAQTSKKFIDPANMDLTVKPGDNFYLYVNGNWIKNTVIPASKTRWGSFDELRQNTDKDALAILKDAAKNPNYSSKTDQGKAINMYKAAMDTVARNKQGINPIKPYLAKINAVKNIKGLQKV